MKESKIENFIKCQRNWWQSQTPTKWHRMELCVRFTSSRHRSRQPIRYERKIVRASLRRKKKKKKEKKREASFERWKWEERPQCRLTVSFQTRRIVNWKGRVVRGPPKQTCVNVFVGDHVYVRFLLISTASETKVSLFRFRSFSTRLRTSIILEYKFQDLIVRRPWPGRFICNSSIAPRQRSITSFDLMFSIITMKIVLSFIHFAM